ncbi:MAG TPA: HYR domain-containing protein [Chryseolinea sp.]|nr:HYR domain-containing protein [Chryseolinea sp.]
MIDNFFLAERMTMIASRLSYPLRIVIVLVVLASTDVMGQNCDCPPAPTCGACSGGFTEMTLRYKGTTSGYVTVYDGLNQIYFDYRARNETIFFKGSMPNGKFSSSSVSVHFNFNLVPNAMFGTSCGDEFPGSASGMFEVVSIVSFGGGPVCCQSSSMDDDAPNISNMPSNQEVDLAPTDCSRTVDWMPPMVTDACSYTTTPTHYPKVTLFTAGTVDVIYTAVDKYGNSSSKTFKVTVRDITPPTINCPASITLPANAECKATYTLPTVTATDNCGTIQATHDHKENTFPLGTTTVIYTAKDASGNKSTCSMTVTVEDRTKPVFVNRPADISAIVDNSCKAQVTWKEPTVTDNCTSDVKLISSHDKDYEFKVGKTTVKYTAVDNAGNSDTLSFKVVVNNPTVPEIEGCPGTVTVNSEPNSNSTIVTWDSITATVTCGDVKVKKSHEPGSNFPIGITQVTYTFTDDAGKSSICEFDVHVLQPDELFAISKVVTPDGDGINDVWKLSNIEKFKSNTVVVIDRWGNKIFQATGYDNERNVWKGTNSSGTIVPTGTYFYTIEVRDQGKVFLKKGFIEVIQ